MEDIAIIELYWARNELAITESDRKYGPLCRRVAFNILSSREDSEECVNDTWHRAWDTMPPQRPDSLRAYLGRIVRNLSISRLRQRTAQKRGSGLDVMLSELGDCLSAPQNVEQQVQALDLSKAISAWLRLLPEDERALFIRRYWYGDAPRELARVWGCSPNQISKRLLRLRRALRAHLEQEGIDV